MRAEVMRQAREYLYAHPELYQQALERAKRMRHKRNANALGTHLVLNCAFGC
jgi:hypothetical protein